MPGVPPAALYDDTVLSSGAIRPEALAGYLGYAADVQDRLLALKVLRRAIWCTRPPPSTRSCLFLVPCAWWGAGRFGSHFMSLDPLLYNRARAHV